ncbi:MAG: 1-acyl-sn-glycerol-3-phosphate acyltransferase [Rhizobacter sp.]|nr:1-acyl-sn-glycerol-3-phosphate acyltransferase [Ferruginibacter sp.]
MNNQSQKNNFLLDAFARIWAMWGIVTFIVTFLIIFLPSMLAYLFADEKKGQAYFIAVSRVWMNVWLPLIGCRLKVTGTQFFKQGENYVVVYNHNALLDVPLSAPFVPGANKTIAKASFAKVPLFGLFYKRGSILVDRKNERSRVQSFEQMKRTLLNGMHMCIYPEGTRNRTREPMKPFYDGAFKLAVDTKKAIIPCIITGTKKAMPVHKAFYLLPARLNMQFLPPVAPEGMTSKSLKEKVFGIMLEKYSAAVQ